MSEAVSTYVSDADIGPLVRLTSDFNLDWLADAFIRPKTVVPRTSDGPCFPSLEARCNVPSYVSQIEDVYALVLHRKLDAAVDLMFKQIDGFLSLREFERLDEYVSSADPGRLGVKMGIALLGITRPVAVKLNGRAGFVTGLERHANDTGYLAALRSIARLA